MTIAPWNPDARRARIKAVKAMTGPKGLALDDDSYRAMLGGLFPGKRSLTEMSVPQLDTVLDHLKRLTASAATASPADEWRFVFRLPLDRQAHARKLYRLAQRLGPLLNPPTALAPKAYIEGIAARMAGAATRLEFCDAARLHQIVQAAEVFAKRHGV